MQVSFINETTSEYQWIEVLFKAVKGGPIDQIKLSTPVRQSTQYSLTVKNPLTTHATFTATCSINEVCTNSRLNIYYIILIKRAGDLFSYFNLILLLRKLCCLLEIIIICTSRFVSPLWRQI